MVDHTPGEQSCDPQLNEQDLPAGDWTLDRLSEFARRQYQLILSGEKTLAPAYWRLGAALAKARKQFARGRWTAYLKTLEIEKTRSSKAVAIYRAFDTPASLAGITVDEAYAARRAPAATSLPKEESATDASESEQDLTDTLNQVDRQTACLCSALASATHGELQAALGTVRRTIDRLQRLEQDLRCALDVMEQA